MAGTSSPSEVLDAVRAGVDLFDCSYVSTATRSGLALSFPIRSDPAATAPTPSSSAVNLWSMEYRLDKGAMVTGCKCGACRNSRAYVHHLLQVHEMLAEVLLEMHNTHHFLLFMEQIRQEITAGTFEAYVSWFKGQVESEPVQDDEKESRGTKRKQAEADISKEARDPKKTQATSSEL